MTPDLTPALREEIVDCIVDDLRWVSRSIPFETDCNGKAFVKGILFVSSITSGETGRSTEYHKKVSLNVVYVFVDESPVEVTPEVRESIQSDVNQLL